MPQHFVQHFFVRQRVLVLLFALLTQSVTASTAQTTLNRAINTAPPFHVVGGPFSQQGLCDQLLNSIQQQLPDTEQHNKSRKWRQISMFDPKTSTKFSCKANLYQLKSIEMAAA